MNNYIFPLESPLPQSSFDLCHGPFVLGSTQVQQYSDRWACWVATAGIRFGKWTPGQVMNDSLGQADDMFAAGTRPAKVSMCFDQDALPVIAIQKDATTIQVRRKVTGITQVYTFAGLSPLMFYNGVTIQDTGITDAVCLYLDSVGNTLFARFQRDNFAIEYIINTFNATVVALLKTDIRRIAGVQYQTLHGLTDQGRSVYFRSQAYPPPIIYATDKVVLDVSLDGGELFTTIVFGSTSDKMALDAALDSGTYLDTTLSSFAPADKMTLDAALDSGTYLPTQITKFAPGDKITLTVALDSGTYTQTIFSSPHPSDKMALDVSLDGGNYV